MRADHFYSSNNLEKYPGGKLHLCKDCLTMHVDNYRPDTYLWILEECDVPFVPKEWNGILRSYAQKHKTLTGKTIVGRYLSKMKLNQYIDYRWKDSEVIQQLENNEIQQTMARLGYGKDEIAQAMMQSSAVLTEDPTKPPSTPEPQDSQSSGEEPVEDYFAEVSGGGEDDFISDLTEEDRTYLRLKWGKTYKPEEWVRLEQLYEEMMGSYDIRSAGHVDTLKLVCKTSLKANQLLDIGDVDGAQKMVKMYDGLMKSGNFTAVQNKEETRDFIDSIGEIVELCEKQGYIERYYIDKPNDKVDLTIQDMQRYTKTLIEEETNLSLMVEKALRENEKEDLENKNNDELEIVDEMDLSLEEIEKTFMKDSDYSEFEDFIEQESLLDQEYLDSVGD